MASRPATGTFAGGEAGQGRLLVATAVALERDAVLAGCADQGPVAMAAAVTVAVVGVGPADAAATTARLLALAEAAGRPYRGVVSVGIAGGFADRVPVGGLVLASRSIHADLGAASPTGFLPAAQLGLGPATHPADPTLLAELRTPLPSAIVGDVLTVATVTGTHTGAEALAAAHPAAVAEGMEGYGVASAAVGAGTAFAELRAISNVIGPRDRAAWRISDALATLTAGVAALRWRVQEVVEGRAERAGQARPTAQAG